MQTTVFLCFVMQVTQNLCTNLANGQKKGHALYQEWN